MLIKSLLAFLFSLFLLSCTTNSGGEATSAKNNAVSETGLKDSDLLGFYEATDDSTGVKCILADYSTMHSNFTAMNFYLIVQNSKLVPRIAMSFSEKGHIKFEKFEIVIKGEEFQFEPKKLFTEKLESGSLIQWAYFPTDSTSLKMLTKLSTLKTPERYLITVETEDETFQTISGSDREYNAIAKTLSLYHKKL